MAGKSAKATFVEPMLLQRTEKLPEGKDWLYELKFDGYRALAIKSGGTLRLRSRNDNDFTARYPGIVDALAGLPGDTIIDGEVVPLDADGKPSFNMLQNYGSAGVPLHFYVFDLLVLRGIDLMGEPLGKRRELLEKHVLPKLSEPVRYSHELTAGLQDLIESARALKLEGIVAKRRDSKYEPGLRSGAWQKMRVNQGQEFVIAGYTPSSKNFDALVIGYYDGGKLIYAARLTLAMVLKLKELKKPLEIEDCPFANLPEKKAGRWGAGLTAAKMSECRWLKPELVGQFEFVEWTSDNHLRHSRFIALRDDKKPKSVTRGQ
jgi:DNA ligase D-like protein (predicted ligase)